MCSHRGPSGALPGRGAAVLLGKLQGAGSAGTTVRRSGSDRPAPELEVRPRE